jgi:hypothetical protein
MPTCRLVVATAEATPAWAARCERCEDQTTAELKECQRIINRKVNTYEQHLTGAGEDLWMTTT